MDESPSQLQQATGDHARDLRTSMDAVVGINAALVPVEWKPRWELAAGTHQTRGLC